MTHLFQGDGINRLGDRVFWKSWDQRDSLLNPHTTFLKLSGYGTHAPEWEQESPESLNSSLKCCVYLSNNVNLGMDRLSRFDADWVFAVCEAKQVEAAILNQGGDTPFEEDLAQDVLEIVTVFSARLYGSRSRKNQQVLDGVKHAVEEASS